MPVTNSVDLQGQSERFTTVLECLVGQRLCIARNAGNMKNFHFGKTWVRDGCTMGQFALHIQCPWRLEGGGRILTGSGDYYVRADENQDPDWEPGMQTGHRQDEVLKTLFGLKSDALPDAEKPILTVLDARSTIFGDIELVLSFGYRLVIFPASSREEEWRLLPLANEGPHSVWTADTK